MSDNPVNLNPSSFAEDGGFLDMSVEDVVFTVLDREKRRHKEAKDDENQQEVKITARGCPMGLTSVLDSTSHDLGISRSMLTRCLSHQIAVWYDNIPDMNQLVELFYEAHRDALDHGYPDLCDRVRFVRYSLSSNDTHMTSFKTIAWAHSKLSNLSLPLGLPTGVLFVIGLCRSVSVNGSGYFKGTLETYIRGEVAKFTDFVGERLIDVRKFQETVQLRISRLETWKHGNMET